MRQMEYKYIVAIVGVFSIFMELIDMTIVNVALPTLSREFDVESASTIQWVMTGYLISLAIFIPVSGWAGDRFGTKRVFMFALTVFTTASLLCALSPSIEALILFRFLQGVGGGMLSPVAFSMVWRAFPPEERSKAAGIMVVPAAVAPASGPVVGGMLVEYASWHWIFLVNLPIGITALSSRGLPARGEAGRSGEVRPGGICAGRRRAGFADLCADARRQRRLYRSGVHRSRDRVDGAARRLRAGRAPCRAADARRPHPPEPAVPRLQPFWIVTMFGGTSMIFLLTLELQAGRGLSPVEAGLTTFVMAIGVIIVAQPASRIYRVVGPQRLIGMGLTVCAAVTLGLYWVNYDTNLWVIRAMMLTRGLGFGFVLVPLQAATYAQISAAQTGRATALYNATSQVGSSLGVAVAAAFLTNRLAHYGAILGAPQTRDASLDAFQASFLLMGVLSAIGVGVAVLIRDRDAAATMRPAEFVPVGDQRAAGEPAA